jgi:hypothetical protein
MTPNLQPTKTCPNCGREVLELAKVCKHCRHRFSESKPSVDELLEQESQNSRSGSKFRFVAFGLVAVVLGATILIVFWNQDSDRSSDAADAQPQLTELKLEEELNTQVRSKTGVEIQSIDCDEGGVKGEAVDCDVTFASGQIQPILVEITEVEPNPRIEIGLAGG